LRRASPVARRWRSAATLGNYSRDGAGRKKRRPPSLPDGLSGPSLFEFNHGPGANESVLCDLQNSYKPFEVLPRLGEPLDQPHAFVDRQIAAARALLGIDGKKLAEMSGVSLVTVRRIEADPDASGYARQALISTLEKAGCDFIEDHGVVLRRAATSRA
jgi:hypothetical protein